MEITLRFKLEKTTPGALRYQELGDDGLPKKIENGAKVGTLYVRKSAVDGDEPKMLEVKITTL